MEGLVTEPPWTERRTFVTGHTGFKGSWLTMWLSRSGAQVHGFALEPPTQPSLFQVARVDRLLASDTREDLASLGRLTDAMRSARPSVVFHLAAQPLVRDGHADPIGTFRTNTMGTAHLLEAVRHTPEVRAVVIVSTDKVYADDEPSSAYRESDPLGGSDPYSASKAAAEIVVAGYRQSFFGGPGGHAARVATARAGNVIGGGDWATDRLVPDCLRAFGAGLPVVLRYPDAVRPWQHVLEPIGGYITLATRLLGPDAGRFASAWNFGPPQASDVTVRELAGKVATQWGNGAEVEVDVAAHLPEAPILRLDSTRTRSDLAWHPRWTLDCAVGATLEWHRAFASGADMLATSLAQIEAFEQTSDAAAL
jgi:CDP-glucose 4,6-dehydratase